MDYSEILEKALAEGKQRHPSAPMQQHAAFANGVAYLMTGASGGYGGPSCREHAVTRVALLKGGGRMTSFKGLPAIVPGEDSTMPGQWTWEDAIALADPVCYGPIEQVHFACYREEHCFDDAPEDIEALKKFSAQGGSR